MTKLASAALAVALALSVAAGQDAPAVTAADSTNLSIQIGCLQAEYYSYAADGTGLTAAQRGGGPAPIGARKSSATEPIKKVLREFAAEHIAIIERQREGLGPLALPCPQIDFGAAARVAAAAGFADPPFDPFGSELFVLIAALQLEDIAVTGTVGSLELLYAAGAEFSIFAARLLGTESAHAGVWRALLYRLYAEGAPGAYGLDVAELVLGSSRIRDFQDGPTQVEQGIVEAEGPDNTILPGAKTTLTATSAGGLPQGRSVQEVLAILYSGTQPGGFYPNGVNGIFGPNPKPPVAVCAPRWAQCGGGSVYTGPTCCDAGSSCVRKNGFYAQCKPAPSGSGVIRVGQRCSGSANEGKTCQAGSTCTKVLPNFSKCVPDP